MRPDSLLRLWCFINPLLTYLLTSRLFLFTYLLIYSCVVLNVKWRLLILTRWQTLSWPTASLTTASVFRLSTTSATSKLHGTLCMSTVNTNTSDGPATDCLRVGRYSVVSRMVTFPERYFFPDGTFPVKTVCSWMVMFSCSWRWSLTKWPYYTAYV